MKEPIDQSEKNTATTISLGLAQIRIKAWLNTMSHLPIFKDKRGSIPRAIYISFEDIAQLQEDCRQQYGDDKLSGIRVYFGLAGEIEPEPRSTTDIRGLVVPVLKTESGRHGKDGIFLDHENPDPDKTHIYDFTTPCPAYCDKSSELYLPAAL